MSDAKLSMRDAQIAMMMARFREAIICLCASVRMRLQPCVFRVFDRGQTCQPKKHETSPPHPAIKLVGWLVRGAPWGAERRLSLRIHHVEVMIQQPTAEKRSSSSWQGVERRPDLLTCFCLKTWRFIRSAVGVQTEMRMS